MIGVRISNIITPAVLNAGQIDNTAVGDNSITDAKIDFGTGPGQVNTDNLPEGSTNLFFTDERVDDRVNGLLQAGSNITLTYDDVANTLTIDSTQSTYGDSDAIAAVEGETTLELSEGLTVDTDIFFGDYDLLDNTNFPTTGLKVVKPSTKVKWAGISVIEYGGSYSGELPFTNFHNPTIGGEAHGGTEASPTAVPNGKRVLQINGSARYGTGAGETHTIANIVINTNENQSSTARGGAMTFRVTPNGDATTRDMLRLRGNGSTEMFLDLDEDGYFTTTKISSQSTNGIEVNSATTFTDLLTLDPVDYGSLPSSPVRGSIAYLVNDGAGTFQNQPIYYEGSQWQYFADGTAVATS